MLVLMRQPRSKNFFADWRKSHDLAAVAFRVEAGQHIVQTGSCGYRLNHNAAGLGGNPHLGIGLYASGLGDRLRDSKSQ